ncbi:YDG domain-containing protein [Comamonas sp. lk]|uniref:YDG domain-containing protein n=1 Tax=Comamonas sp. lk TaxID=2201272 RepID=UPI0013CE78C9|nr:YDG domain-containing protein [Comamonas sp. lk]
MASKVSDSYSSAVVSGSNSYSGGLIGRATGSAAATVGISNAYATGTVGSSGNNVGALLGGITGGNVSLSNVYATGSATASGTGNVVGGLIGNIDSTIGAGSAVTISNARASGDVSTGLGRGGGLIGRANGYANITSSYATGNVSGGSTIGILGGLIGDSIGGGVGGITITRSYASGNVTGNGAGTLYGGLIGQLNNTNVSASFASGNVSGNNTVGGLVGYAVNTFNFTDVYALGNVTATATTGIGYAGGLFGQAVPNSFTSYITNAYAAGDVDTSAPTKNLGGIVGLGGGTNFGTLVLTNTYWDATASAMTSAVAFNNGGTIRYATGTAVPNASNNTLSTAAAGALTTAQLTSGTLPTNFNTGATANGNPWGVTAGFTPYFNWQFPAGAMTISGTAYTSAGAAAGSGTVKLYTNGNLISGGQVRTDNTTGTYTALVGIDTFANGYKLGGTLTLNGAGSISGLSYTDSPFFSGGNITGFDLRQGVLLATTADTSNSALQTSLGNTFGSSNYTSLTSTLGSALWQYNASGNFTVDTALSHGGSTGLYAAGNLALNAAVTATGSTLMLSAGGSITDGASGAITANNLVLLGGDVALDGSSNNVNTLAASGVSNLIYSDSNALTVGAVTGVELGVNASAINGTSATVSGIAASGNVLVSSGGSNTLTVSRSVQSSAATGDATVTLRAGRDLSVGDGLLLGGTGSNKTNVVLWSGYTATGLRGTVTVGNAGIDTRGGLFYLGGALNTDANGGVRNYNGVSVPSSEAAAFFSSPGFGASLTGTTINTGGGDIVIKGRSNVATGSNGGVGLRGVTLGSGSGNVLIEGGVARSDTTSVAVSIDGATSISATGAGTVSITGTNSSSGTGASWSRGVQITASSGNNVAITTQSGALTITGSDSSGSSDSQGIRLENTAPATATLKITSTSGNVSLVGTQSSSQTTANVQGIAFIADGSAAAGAIRVGADGSNAYTGDLLVRGTSIVHGASTSTAGAVSLGGSGSLTIDSPGTTFTQALVLDSVYNIGSAHSSLTVGKTTNTADVTNSAARTVAGPISIYGGNLSVTTGATLTSTAASAAILLKATAGITDAASIVTNGGDITLWSNSADATTGGIYVQDNVTLDTRRQADRTAGNTSTASGGGAITIGGGSASSTLASGTVVPTGSATAITGASSAVQFGTDNTTGHIGNVSIYTGGGDLSVRGHNTSAFNAQGSFGISAYAGFTVDAGVSGSVTMVGTSSAVGAPSSQGIDLVARSAGNASTVIRTHNGSISLTGTANGGSATNNGVQLSSYNTFPVSLVATGSGGISITGNAAAVGSSSADISLASANILAASGAINLTGTGAGNLLTWTRNGIYAMSLGAKAGSLVTSSTSNITITEDSFSLTAGDSLTFNTSGTATIESYGNNFSSTLNTSQFGYASTVSGLRLGKDTGLAHTDTININSAVNIAGPISAYAGTIATSSALTSNNADANILLKATGGITVGGSITANAGDITLWSNSLDAATGGIYVLDNTKLDSRTAADRTAGNTSTASGGGTITLGGGSASSTLASGTVVPTGYALNNGRGSGVLLATDTNGHNANIAMLSGGGDVSIRGRNTASQNGGYSMGIGAMEGLNIDAGTSGSITLNGDVTATASGQALGVFLGFLSNANGGFATSTLRTADGNISVTGTANSSAPTSTGVALYQRPTSALTLAATGTGSLTVNGTATGGNPRDVLLASTDLLAASGPITVTGNGAGTLVTVTNNASYAMSLGSKAGSLVTSSTSNITLTDDSFALSAGNGLALNTSGTVTLQPYTNNFSTAFGLSNLSFASTISNLTVGKDIGATAHTDTVNLNAAVNIAGPISVYANTINLSQQLATAGSGNNGRITLDADTAATQTGGSLSGTQLLLQGPGSFTLNQTTNTIGTLAAASGTGNISYVDSDALTIGTVGSTNGISSTGTVSVATQSGDLTVAQSIATTNAGTSAITLNAGKAAAAGTAAGGNIVVSGGPAITTGTGGRATLYSGSTANSSLATLVGSGSGRFRYNSDEAATNYTAVLGTGLYGIYRQSISTAFALDDISTVYGTAATLNTSNALVNGDAATFSIANPLLSTSGNVRVGSYGVSVTNLSALTALGYTATGNSSAMLTVTAKALTIGDITAGDKVYDGSRNATISTAGASFDGLVAGDKVTVAATGSFGDKNVANGKTVTLVNTNGGADAGNYTITNQATTTASITPKTLTVSQITAADKVYDGTAAANVVTGSVQYTGLVVNDDVKLTASSGVFGNKNAGNGKTVTLSNTYSGTDKGNYLIVDQTSATASISQAQLQISTNDVTKVYDGTTAVFGGAAITVGGTRLFGDDTLSGGTFAYTSKNVGLGNKVVVGVTGATINDGNSGGNYAVSYVNNTNSTITAKALSISGITADNKIYDGSRNATISTAGASFDGLVAGDKVTVAATGSFGDKNVANGKTVTLVNTNGGADAGNYTITNQATTTASITPKTLTVSQITAADKVYDGTAAANVVTGSVQYTGLVVNDDVKLTASSGVFGNKNAGNGKTVTLSNTYSGTDKGNYLIVDQTSATASISQAQLQISTNDVTKVYDGTTAVFGGAAITVGGTRLFGDDTLSGGTFAYTSKNVGLGNKVVVGVTGATINDGNSGGNYAVSYVNNTNSTITAKALSISGITADNKIYDGSRNATISTAGASFDGLVAGDKVTVAATGSFGDKNVANGKTVTLVNTNGGADAGNYTITNQATTTASITPKTLTVSQITAADKVYDGTAAANVVTGSVQYTGLVVNDDVKLTASSGVFGNKNAGNGKTVTLSNTYSGTDKGNYLIVDQTSATASISQAQLQISTNDVTKVYDGTTAVFGGAAITVGGTRLFGDDTLSGGTFAYTSKNVGLGNKVVVGVTGATINDGNSGGNYAVSYVNNTNSTITAKALSISGITADNKIYDGSRNATISTAGASFDGLVAGDKVTVAATGSFGDKNVANGKTVTLVNTNGGADAGNYTITNQATTTASITPKTLTVSQITAADKVYDGTAAANVVTGSVQYTGLVVNDDVKLTASSGVFGNKNAGNGKTVTLSNTYSGTDKGNYLIVDQTSATASISQAQLQISTNDVTKVYDGTTAVFGGAAITVGGTRLFGDDTLSGGTFAYTSKNVGIGNKVVVGVTGATINDGNSGGNYAVSYVNNTNSTITAKALSISGITADNKIYDGSRNATISTAGASFDGLVAGDKVTVAATGSFGDKNVANGKTVTLVNTNGGADAGNYTITNQATTTASITPKTLTVSQITAADKVYYGTAAANVVTGSVQYTGLVVNDDVKLTASSGVFGNKNAGTGKSVLLSNTYSGSDLSNYTLVDQTSATASITPAALTLTTGNVSKTYDGTTDVSGGAATVASGMLYIGDTLTGGTFAYTDKNAGAGSKVVTVSGVSVSDGNSGGNYTLSYVNNTASTINKATLTVSGITAADKVYDGNTNVLVSTAGLIYTGLVVGDQVTTDASGQFVDRNAGIGKSLTLLSSYGGTDVGNYQITSQTSANATISKAGLTVTANDDARFVTRNDIAGYNGVHYSGFVGGDTAASLDLSGLVVNRPNGGVGAGVYTGALQASGVASGNYTISYAAGNYTILAANNALVKTVNQETSYGTVPTYTVASVEYMDNNNLISTLTQSGHSGNSYSYSDGVGGTLSFALGPRTTNLSSSGLVSVGNYTIADANPVIGGGNLTGAVTFIGNLAVQAKAVSASAGGVSKIYDGTTAMNGVTLNLTGQFDGDTVTVNGRGNFSQKNVGNNLSYSVTDMALDGADGANYYLSGGSSLSGNNGSITPKTITVGGITAADKVYDAGKGATVNTAGANYGGLITGDDVGVIATGLFGDKNVGSGKTVTLSSSYSGADKDNYIFIDQATTTAAITPKALTVSGLAVANRTYDGTTGATVDLSGATYTGLIAGDFVQVAASGSFADKNAGADKLATLNSRYSGADVGNYSITDQASTTGDIFAAALSVSSGNVSKVYDGGTSAAGSATVVGGQLFGGDTLSGGSFAFSNKNAGAGNKTVHVSGATLSDGNNGGNYRVTYVDNTSSTITAKAVTVGGITGVDKVYDAALGATVNTAGVNYGGGLISGDDVTAIATGLFGDKNVGNGKTVTLTSRYSGADIANYVFTDQATTTAAITPKALTVSGLAVANRTYDGTTGATVDLSGATYTGLIAGDFVQVAASGSFADKNAGADKLATLNSRYSGADVGNYSITDQASTTGDIFAAALSVSSGNVSKVYDGGTSAAGSATVVGGQLFGGDTLSGGSFAFSNKNAGAGNKTVHVSGATLSDGNNGGNYRVTYVDNTSSTITAKAVTVGGITGVDKVYDAALGATVNTAGVHYGGGLISGDDVTVIATGLFGDKNVGNGKTVTLTSRYSGADIANYVFTDQATTTAAITPKALTVSGLAVANRTYDGTTGATVDLSGATYTGLIAGDFVQVAASGSFADKNAGADKLATLNSRYSGADVGNYSITDQASTTGDITQASITVTVGNVSKVYDGMTGVSGATALLASGMLFGSDALTGGSLAFADKNAGAGNKTVLVGGFGVSDGNSGGNYTVSYLNNTTSTITPKALTVSGIAGVDRVYDGTIQAGVDTSALVLGGLISGDNLQLVSSAGNFADKNAGQGKTVTLANSYSGADLGNYQITDQTGTTASIKQRMVSLSGQPDTGDLSKVYDGTTHVNIDTSGVTIGGLLTGDKLGYQASGTTADKNVGVDKNVTIVGGLTGEDAGNYQIELPTLSGKVTVTAKVLTLDGITAGNKVYDRTTDATLGLADAVFSGAVEGDNVGYTASGAFSDKNAGMHKTVFLNTGLSGADAGNYTLSGQSTTTADITARIITIDNVPGSGGGNGGNGGSGGDLSKVYDGTTHVNIDTSGVTIGGLLTGDKLGYQASGTTADKNVGVDKNVTIVGGLTGEDAGNYQIELPTLSGKVTVTPKILTVDGTVAQDKVFDGSTGAILSGATLSGGGVLGADDVRLLNQGQGSFDTASVGNGKTVNSAMTLGGDDAGNYLLSQPGGLVASITPPSVPQTPDAGVPPVLTPEPPRPPGFVPEQPVGGAEVLTGTPQLPALPGLDKTPTVVSGQEARSDVAPGREGFAQGALVAESVAVLMSVGDAVRTGDNFISVTHFEVLSLRPATPFTFALPKDTFVHSNSAEPLSIEARLADGQPLPSWLRFDGQGWVFSGMPPEGSSTLDVVVIARDAGGHRAQTQVQLSFR